MIDIENLNVKNIVEEIKRENKKEWINPYLNERYYKFSNLLKEYKEIVILGAGKYGEALYKMILQLGVQSLICFADNSFHKYPQGFHELKVLSIEEALKKYPNAYYVVTPRFYKMELVGQLVKGGLAIEKIVLFEPENMGLRIE